MGCSSSSPTDPNNNPRQKKPLPVDQTDEQPKKKERGQPPELRQEPEIEDVDVPKTEAGYPMARPPKDKKADIFDPKRMTGVDKRAREVPQNKMDTFDDLVRYLKSGFSSDLEWLRAIFVWMGSQQIDRGDYSDVTDSDTPRGYMRLVRDNRLSYAALFAVVCRKAGIPCVIINGYAKSAGYEAGDSEDKIQTLTNSWNAAYVKGSWRLVFPLWACTGVVGYSSGAYTKVESKGQAVRETETQASGTTIYQLDEYYFLTDPEEFIYVAMAKEQRWQLLSQPWTLKKFAEVPYCRETFFTEKVRINSKKFSCRLTAWQGECNVELSCDHPADMTMDYELYYNNEESGKEISSSLQLSNYVFLNRTPTTWNFGLRFPETGVYKLEIVGGRRLETDLCYFKIVCYEVQEDCQPLPVNPGPVGYGPNQETERAGLHATSHKDGLVKMVPHKETEFQFNMSKSVAVRTELIHSEISKEELQKYIRQMENGRKLTVKVAVAQPGEYALQLHAKGKGSSSYTNVCNYLLTSNEGKKKRTRLWENPIEKRARTSMQILSKNKGTREQDVKELESAIERFENMDLDDKGDLSTAQEALAFKLAKKDIRDAINRRHLETLEGAIDRGKNSRFCDRLTDLIKQAEDVRDHLVHLNRIAHDVLEMKQPTISELRSYKYPQDIIHRVMAATFIMLGEKKEHTEEWEDLQILMGRTGKGSMIRRVKEFDTVDVRPETKRVVDHLISGYNEMGVRQASAGAGTFYKWLQSVSGVLDEQQGAQENQEQEQENQGPGQENQGQGQRQDNQIRKPA